MRVSPDPPALSRMPRPPAVIVIGEVHRYIRRADVVAIAKNVQSAAQTLMFAAYQGTALAARLGDDDEQNQTTSGD